MKRFVCALLSAVLFAIPVSLDTGRDEMDLPGIAVSASAEDGGKDTKTWRSKVLPAYTKFWEEATSLMKCTLRIYVDDPYIIRAFNINEKDLVEYPTATIELKFYPFLNEYAEHFKSLTEDKLIPFTGRGAIFISPHIYCVLETEEYGKILDLLFGGSSDGTELVRINGLWFEQDAFISEFLWPFLPESVIQTVPDLNWTRK